MKLLSGFLERFSQLTPPERVVIDAVQQVIHELFSYEISKECIKVRDDTVMLSMPSVLRTELFKQKEVVLAAINKKLGAQRIFELR